MHMECSDCKSEDRTLDSQGIPTDYDIKSTPSLPEERSLPLWEDREEDREDRVCHSEKSLCEEGLFVCWQFCASELAVLDSRCFFW